MTKEYDYSIKLLFVGESGVGKSNLLLRFVNKTYSESYTTIGVDFKIRTIEIDGEKVKLKILDTAGQEGFGTITWPLYRRIDGVILVYDVTDGITFTKIKEWFDEIDKKCGNVNKILVGNKNDDPKRKVVLTEDAQRFADQMGIQLFETSAKENINVEEMINSMTRMVLRTKKEQKDRQNSNENAIILHEGSGHNSTQNGQQNINNKCC